tara:strand:- start:861 stop:1232 length:372 start_codon:yes stop_codon:yes gene_type:complete
MTSYHFADIVLFVHLIIALFIVSLFVVIPFGYKLKWNWIKNRKLRLFHIILMFFVTLETIMGITCPLTIIENNLRGIMVSNSFINTWIKKILFFDFPSEYFLITYILCSLWTTLIWIKFPPEN